LVGAVVGLEISITRWYGKWKVSQNRSVADRLAVIEGLEHQASESSIAMAALVKETLGEC
jgi:transcriptional regulator